MNVDTSIWVVLLAAGLLIAILLVAWRVSVMRRARRDDPMPSYEERLEGLKPESEERVASAASERIEFMVRQRLAGHPDLAEKTIDFGTQEDGTLGIWIEGEKYEDPGAIPDERIRIAVQEAVAEFNE
ncbi:MAG: hypothetical protein R3191_04070 [Anaerolineales bacterium]|nr:hypothetical protein [Anaerolineales bacterium]